MELSDYCSCNNLRVVIEHASTNKQLKEFTREQLADFPLDYLLYHCTSVEILNAWPNLPLEVRSDFRLRTKLPCFVHFNRPEWEDEVDGPPSSQSQCQICKLGLDVVFKKMKLLKEK